MPTLRRLTLTLLLALLGALPLSVQANDATWQALQEGGLVILMRLPPGWIRSSAGAVIRRQLLKPLKSKSLHGRNRGIYCWSPTR